MNARKSFIFGLFLLSLWGCSKRSLLSADCHSCTEEEQSWQEFSWNNLNGRWRGEVQSMRNNPNANKKVKEEKRVEIRFFEAANFLESKNVNGCSGLPSDAIILNGLLWERSSPQKVQEYESFVKTEDGKVAYGRVAFEHLNGQEICHFQRMGRVMSKNRLNLPAIRFTEVSESAGRVLASTSIEKENGSETEVSVEFLRFDPMTAKVKGVFAADERRPASMSERERPPLFLRVFKSSSQREAGGGSKWSGTEEYLYRFWKLD